MAEETERVREGWGERNEKNSGNGRAREGESAGDQGSQREDFILFYSMFPFLGSFPRTLSAPCLTPTQGRFGCLPSTLPLYLGCLQPLMWGVGVQVSKAQGLAKIIEAETAICLVSEVGVHPGTSPYFVQTHFLPQFLSLRSHWTESALARSSCRT